MKRVFFLTLILSGCCADKDGQQLKSKCSVRHHAYCKRCVDGLLFLEFQTALDGHGFVQVIGSNKYPVRCQND